MKKYLIEELLDGETTGEFNEAEVGSQQYRVIAETRYFVRLDGDYDSTGEEFQTKEEALKKLDELGGQYCMEEVVLHLETGEEMTEPIYYFADEEIYGVDDYEEYGNYEGKVIVEE